MDRKTQHRGPGRQAGKPAKTPTVQRRSARVTPNPPMAEAPAGSPITVTELHCIRCHHDWVPRRPVRPVECPGCGSSRWNTTRRVPPPESEITCEKCRPLYGYRALISLRRSANEQAKVSAKAKAKRRIRRQTQRPAAPLPVGTGYRIIRE